MQVSLRNNVEHNSSGSNVEINHSLWRLRINSTLLKESGAAPLFNGSAKYVTFDVNDKLLALLRAQGCLSVPEKENYSSDEIFEIFNGVSLNWYLEYYEHELWNKLRSGQSSKNELVTWLIHNYHVSVNAGITHARMGAVSNDITISDEHKKCSLEEYWHANSFYFVKGAGLVLENKDIKEYIQLSSSYAFQIHLRYLAEYDHLAYTLVSYFQERTIMFHEDCERFYKSVERAYDAPKLFDGWRKHINLDIELDHRNKRSEIVSGFEETSDDKLKKSINNARKAASLLVASLDDVIKHADSSAAITLRLPYDGGVSDVNIAAMASKLNFALSQGLQGLVGVIDEMIAQYEKTVRPNINVPFLHNAIHQSAFIFLGRSRYHDEIMVAGDLAKLFAERESVTSVATLAMEAARNHLYEVANHYRDEYLSAVIVVLRLLYHSGGPDVHREKAVVRLGGELFGRLTDDETQRRRLVASIMLLLELVFSGSLDVCVAEIDPNVD